MLTPFLEEHGFFCVGLERLTIMQKWIIIPKNTPEIITCCSKCGSGSRFECSNSFRINANGKALDVWLIYKCSACNTTLNIEILSRVKHSQIGKALYSAFVENDIDTARYYAFDSATMKRNKVVVGYENVGYDIEKSEHDGDAGRLEIVMDLKLPIRLDKLLGEGFGLSRSTVQCMLEGMEISCAEQEVSANMKVKRGLVLRVNL